MGLERHAQDNTLCFWPLGTLPIGLRMVAWTVTMMSAHVRVSVVTGLEYSSEISIPASSMTATALSATRPFG